MLADDPDLTVRLPGLEKRSPHRFVMLGRGGAPKRLKMLQNAAQVPVTVITDEPELPAMFTKAGVTRMVAERTGHQGLSGQGDGFALPELMEDMAASGISSLMVEGGARIAQSFLDAGLVDRIELFTAVTTLVSGRGEAPILSPISREALLSPPPANTKQAAFQHHRTTTLNGDRLDTFYAINAKPKEF